MRRSHLIIRADDIVFKYQLSEWRLSNKIRKPCEAEENKHVAEWLTSMDNANLVRSWVYFCLFCISFCHWIWSIFFGLWLEIVSLETWMATAVIDYVESEYAIFISRERVPFKTLGGDMFHGMMEVLEKLKVELKRHASYREIYNLFSVLESHIWSTCRHEEHSNQYEEVRRNWIEVA